MSGLGEGPLAEYGILNRAWGVICAPGFIGYKTWGFMVVLVKAFALFLYNWWAYHRSLYFLPLILIGLFFAFAPFQLAQRETIDIIEKGMNCLEELWNIIFRPIVNDLFLCGKPVCGLYNFLILVIKNNVKVWIDFIRGYIVQQMGEDLQNEFGIPADVVDDILEFLDVTLPPGFTCDFTDGFDDYWDCILDQLELAQPDPEDILDCRGFKKYRTAMQEHHNLPYGMLLALKHKITTGEIVPDESTGMVKLVMATAGEIQQEGYTPQMVAQQNGLPAPSVDKITGSPGKEHVENDIEEWVSSKASHVPKPEERKRHTRNPVQSKVYTLTDLGLEREEAQPFKYTPKEHHYLRLVGTQPLVPRGLAQQISGDGDGNAKVARNILPNEPHPVHGYSTKSMKHMTRMAVHNKISYGSIIEVNGKEVGDFFPGYPAGDEYAIAVIELVCRNFLDLFGILWEIMVAVFWFVADLALQGIDFLVNLLSTGFDAAVDFILFLINYLLEEVFQIDCLDLSSGDGVALSIVNCPCLAAGVSGGLFPPFGINTPLTAIDQIPGGLLTCIGLGCATGSNYDVSSVENIFEGCAGLLVDAFFCDDHADCPAGFQCDGKIIVGATITAGPPPKIHLTRKFFCLPTAKRQVMQEAYAEFMTHRRYVNNATYPMEYRNSLVREKQQLKEESRLIKEQGQAYKLKANQLGTPTNGYYTQAMGTDIKRYSAGAMGYGSAPPRGKNPDGTTATNYTTLLQQAIQEMCVDEDEDGDQGSYYGLHVDPDTIYRGSSTTGCKSITDAQITIAQKWITSGRSEYSFIEWKQRIKERHRHSEHARRQSERFEKLRDKTTVKPFVSFGSSVLARGFGVLDAYAKMIGRPEHAVDWKTETKEVYYEQLNEVSARFGPVGPSITVQDAFRRHVRGKMEAMELQHGDGWTPSGPSSVVAGGNSWESSQHGFQEFPAQFGNSSHNSSGDEPSSSQRVLEENRQEIDDLFTKHRYSTEYGADSPTAPRQVREWEEYKKDSEAERASSNWNFLRMGLGTSGMTGTDLLNTRYGGRGAWKRIRQAKVDMNQDFMPWARMSGGKSENSEFPSPLTPEEETYIGVEEQYGESEPLLETLAEEGEEAPDEVGGDLTRMQLMLRAMTDVTLDNFQLVNMLEWDSMEVNFRVPSSTSILRALDKMGTSDKMGAAFFHMAEGAAELNRDLRNHQRLPSPMAMIGASIQMTITRFMAPRLLPEISEGLIARSPQYAAAVKKLLPALTNGVDPDILVEEIEANRTQIWDFNRYYKVLREEEMRMIREGTYSETMKARNPGAQRAGRALRGIFQNPPITDELLDMGSESQSYQDSQTERLPVFAALLPILKPLLKNPKVWIAVITPVITSRYGRVIVGAWARVIFKPFRKIYKEPLELDLDDLITFGKEFGLTSLWNINYLFVEGERVGLCYWWNIALGIVSAIAAPIISYIPYIGQVSTTVITWLNAFAFIVGSSIAYCPPKPPVVDFVVQVNPWTYPFSLLDCDPDMLCSVKKDCISEAPCWCEGLTGYESLYWEIPSQVEPCEDNVGSPIGTCGCWPLLNCKFRLGELNLDAPFTKDCELDFNYKNSAIIYYQDPTFWEFVGAVWNDAWTSTLFIGRSLAQGRSAYIGNNESWLLFSLAVGLAAVLASRKTFIAILLIGLFIIYVMDIITMWLEEIFIPGVKLSTGFFAFGLDNLILSFIRFPNHSPSDPLGDPRSGELVCFIANIATWFLAVGSGIEMTIIVVSALQAKLFEALWAIIVFYVLICWTPLANLFRCLYRDQVMEDEDMYTMGMIDNVTGGQDIEGFPDISQMPSSMSSLNPRKAFSSVPGLDKYAKILPMLKLKGM